MVLICFSSRKNYGHTELHVDQQLLPHTLPSANGPTDWNEALEIISFGSPEQVSILYCVEIFSVD